MNAPDHSGAPSATRGRSLTARLTLWYGLTAFALVAVSILLLDHALARVLSREEDEILADKIMAIRNLLADPNANPAALQHEVEEGFLWSEKCHVRVLTPGGDLVLESPTAGATLEGIRFRAALGAGEATEGGFNARTKSDQHFRAVSALAKSPQGDRLIVVAVDRGVHEVVLGSYRATAWPLLGAAVIVCALVGYRITRRGLLPVATLAKAARAARSTTLHERLDAEKLPSELVPVARAMNGMFDRLGDSFGRLSQFSADLAHELRTPVSNLRGEIEVTLGRARTEEEYRDVLASCLEGCERLSGIIDSMLFLARAENPTTQIEREDVDLVRELTAIQQLYEPLAAEKGVALKVGEVLVATAFLDRQLLQRAVGNLVANAIAHTPPGGAITVSAIPAENGVRILVKDNGGGIAPADLPFVFDRFFRADRARFGGGARVGLGLAIVKGIANLHGGKVEISSEVGTGTLATLELPK